MEKYKPAFSLLEIMVVMGISTALMAGGVLTLIRFQDSTEFNKIYSNTLSLFVTAQNKSKNGVLSEAKKQTSGGSEADSIPSYYSVIVDLNSKKLALHYCDISVGNVLVCSKELGIEDIILPSEINITANGCAGVGFKTLASNSDLILINSDGTFLTTGTCDFTLTHTGLNNSETLTFNADINVWQNN
jgi:hypothetical protein